MPISPEQCRAARALLNWSQSRLAEGAGVARGTLAEFESGKRTPIVNNMDSLQRTLEAAGVEFIPENGSGPGVRLRKASASQFPDGEAGIIEQNDM